METYECILKIEDEENIHYKDNLQNECRGKVRLDELTRLTINSFFNWIKNYNEHLTGEDFKAFGIHLYNILFDNNPYEYGHESGVKNKSVRSEFEKTFEVFINDAEKNDSIRLKLRLIFLDKAKNLAKYPWEFLCMPFERNKKTNYTFLAGQNSQIILVRFTKNIDFKRFREEIENLEMDKPKNKGLNILVAFCHPKGVKELKGPETDEVIKIIKNLDNSQKNVTDPARIIRVCILDSDNYFKVIDEYLANDDISPLESLKTLCLSELKKNIIDFKPDIFHFIGHGDKGKILLMKEPKDLKPEIAAHRDNQENLDYITWEPIDKICELFTDPKQIPSLVFLDSCRGASPDTNFYKSTAQVLADEKDIPVVVAMQFEIVNSDAALFSKTFYNRLAHGMDIGEAVKEGRRILGTSKYDWSDRCFGTPVIYLNNDNVIKIPVKPETKSKSTKEMREAELSQISGISSELQSKSEQKEIKCINCNGLTPVGNYCSTCGLQIRCFNCNEIIIDKKEDICKNCGEKFTQLRGVYKGKDKEDTQF
jgi:hypothetical protein